MATYVIGDIHGCLNELKELLATINYSPTTDTLWFVGDLVNRGPHSLATLRFIKQLYEQSNRQNKLVLGNHDLFLLSLYAGYSGYGSVKPILRDILQAPDIDELIQWLRFSNLLLLDQARKIIVSHAGVPPIWSIVDCQLQAQKVEKQLQDDNWLSFAQHDMIGNHPELWQPNLSNLDNIRYTINALTRMRLCTADGKLDFTNKDEFSVPHKLRNSNNEQLFAWFELFNQQDWQVIFGHWAALMGNNFGYKQIIAIDGGCSWGGYLIAYNVDTHQRFYIQGKQYRSIHKNSQC